MFTFGELTADAFEKTYWRKRPLFVKGGARYLLDRTMTSVEFRQICDRMDRVRRGLITRRPECIFAQNMNLGSTDLARRARAVETITSCSEVWFDGVYATDDEGIGSHFDHSDNFVLQQSGTKRWFLWPPVADAKMLRARMLEHPDAGFVDQPTDALEFMVEAGDLLYIPLFWGHCGASVGGRSLSLSLVLNANNALDLILPHVKALLNDQEVWWRPAPLVPLCGDADGSAPPPDVRAYLEQLVLSLAEPQWRNRAVEVLWKLAFQKVASPQNSAR